MGNRDISPGLADGATPAEKGRALEQILTSQTFNRCDQLKRILSYLCAKEVEGRLGDTTEYLIGVEALGRSRDFSPADDSSVRSRVHALRKKLQEYYLLEAPGSDFRIDIPKGSYNLQFLHAPHAAAGELEFLSPLGPPLWRGSLAIAAIAFLVGVAASILLGYCFRHQLMLAEERREIPPVVKQAWGPLLGGDEVLVVVATPPQLILRDYSSMPQPKEPEWMPDIPQTQELLEFYGRRQPVTPQTKLLFHPNLSSPLWGDAAAALSAVSTLSAYHVSYRVLPERILQPYLLRDRNVLLVGRPEYSSAARVLMEKVPFAIEYSPELRSFVVRNRVPKPGEPNVYVPRGEDTDAPEEVYGLLTVLPSESAADTRKRTVIFSGLTTAGAMAAEEFFSTAKSLNELFARFQQEGLETWPTSWQLVLKTTVSDPTLPMSFQYAAHRVLQK